MQFLGQRAGLASVDLQCLTTEKSVKNILNPKTIQNQTQTSNSFRFIETNNADQLRQTELGKIFFSKFQLLTLVCISGQTFNFLTRNSFFVKNFLSQKKLQFLVNIFVSWKEIHFWTHCNFRETFSFLAKILILVNILIFDQHFKF